MNNTLKTTLTWLVSLCFIPFCMAKVDGFLGTSSSGALDVQLNLHTVMKISGLKDLHLENELGSGRLKNLSALEKICVFTNKKTDDYDIAFIGKNSADGTFYLKSTSGDSIPYAIEFYDGKPEDSETVQKVISNIAMHEIHAKHDLDTLRCSNVENDGNAGFKIRVAAADYVNKNINDYSDTITIVLGP